MMLNNIKAILLDLGGVVFQSSGTSNAMIDWKVVGQLNNVYGHGLNIGENLFPDFLSDYNQLTGLQLDGPTFLKGIFDTLDFNEGLVNMFRERFDIIIVSDNYRENIAYISERYHFSNWAKKQIYSYDYQMEKANPFFFEKLLQDLDYEAEELLFIDDSSRKLKSAKLHGITGVLFQNNEQVKTALGL